MALSTVVPRVDQDQHSVLALTQGIILNRCSIAGALVRVRVLRSSGVAAGAHMRACWLIISEFSTLDNITIDCIVPGHAE
jgi:hypothetical protein